MEPSLARFVTVGNFEDDLKKLADVDWIIEAVVENLRLMKRALLKKVEAVRKPGDDHHHQYQRPAGRKDRRGISRTTSGARGLAPIFSIRLATCACSN